MEILKNLILGGNIFFSFLSEKETFRFLDKSYEFGIKSIDTSDSYSKGMSETIIGNYFKTVNREKWFLATKNGLESYGKKDECNNPSIITKKLEESLKRLNTSYIDLYQLHHFDPKTPFYKIRDIIQKKKKSGEILKFGLSNYSYEQLSVLESENIVYSLQCHLNVLKRDALEKVIPFCKKNKIKVLIYGVLARGILSGKYLNGIPKNSRANSSDSIKKDLSGDLIKCVKELQVFAKKSSLDLINLCIYWSIKQAVIDNIILGMRGVEQLTNIVNLMEIEPSNNILNDFNNIITKHKFNENTGLGAFIKL